MNAWVFAITWVFGWALLGGLTIAAVDSLAAQHKRRRLTLAGLYPKPGTETDEDVQRLLQAGHQDMAVRCYQVVHRVSYQRAKDRLMGPKPAEYAVIPVGLIFGLSIGLFVRNTALGVALGLLLGVSVGFALLRRKRPPHDGQPQ
jgi:hypothetical protein